MEKFTKGSDYKVMVAKATELGIKYNGVKKEKLAEMLNEAIENKNQSQEGSEMNEIKVEGQEQDQVVEAVGSAEGEAIQSEEAAAAVETEEEVVTQPEAQQQEEGSEVSDSAAEETQTPEANGTTNEEGKTQEATTTNLKWHEEEGAFPYKAGEAIQIIEAYKSVGDGKKVPILKDRYVKVEGPAKTKGKLKGFLLHEKTKEPQKVLITIGLDQVRSCNQEEAFAPVVNVVATSEPETQNEETSTETNVEATA